MMRILILCHNEGQAKFIQKGLFYENIGSDFCEIPENKTVPIRHLSKDAFLILSQNPDADLSLVCNIRHYKKTTPIVFLSEHLPEYFNFKARKAGCDLLFTRPFSFSEIALQIKYLIYLSNSSIRKKILKTNFLRLDLAKRILYKKEEIVPLRNKEFSLLEFLMLNKNRVLSRTEIFENVWDRNADIATNTVDVHVSQLRKKIDINPKNSFIKTINCVGYLFSAD